MHTTCILAPNEKAVFVVNFRWGHCVADVLKIMLVVESADTGAGRHVADLAKELVHLRHDVHLVYSPIRSRQWFESTVRSIDGLSVHRLDMQRSIGLNDFSTAIRLRALLRKFGPFDVVHGHSSKGGALVRLAGWGLNSRTIYTPHAFITLNPKISSLKRRAYIAIERILAGLGDRIICVSEEEHEHAIDIGLPAAGCRIVNNGLVQIEAGDRQEVRRSWGVGEGAVCAGFVGRLSQQKSVDRLLNSFVAAAREVPNLELVIVGDGPCEVALKSLAATLEIESRVHFPGAVNGLAQMAGFDLFVLTSRYEAFPYVFIEAAGSGLPIITMQVGGCSAVVSSGANGYIVPQDDQKGFSGHLATLAQNQELRGRMSAHSRRIAKRFTVSAMTEATVEIYLQALQQK